MEGLGDGLDCAVAIFYSPSVKSGRSCEVDNILLGVLCQHDRMDEGIV